MLEDRVFRTSASRLNLRAGPSTRFAVLTSLSRGQAVARVDEADRDGWWLIFADVPGDGAYIGFAAARFLIPIEDTNATLANQPIPYEPGEDDDEAHPSREPEGAPPPETESEIDTWIDGWNPEIEDAHRHPSPNHNSRSAPNGIERVVIHITGNPNFETVRSGFMRAGGASAHYLIEPNGQLHQFVSEERRAYHAGIKSFVRKLYDRNDGQWRKYKRHFSWAGTGHYPNGSIFYDADLKPVSDRSKAQLVGRADGSEWPAYRYFDSLWGRVNLPVGYAPHHKDPNDYSIGIELLSYGAKRASPEHYSPEMYHTLRALVDDICRRHNIPKSRTNICGHEDVNPVERWGWDPNQGFDWNQLISHGAFA